MVGARCLAVRNEYAVPATTFPNDVSRLRTTSFEYGKGSEATATTSSSRQIGVVVTKRSSSKSTEKTQPEPPFESIQSTLSDICSK